MQIKFITLSLALLLGITACKDEKPQSDAYGNFEADKTYISAEVAGQLLQFIPEEGAQLAANETVGIIDSADIYLKKTQLEIQIQATKANFEQIDAQLEVQKQQLKNAEIAKNRTQNLLESNAATQKQMDEVEGQYNLAKKQMLSIESQKSALNLQIQAMGEQLNQVKLTLSKCQLQNPVKGTVLNTFAREGEMVVPGKALYTLADLNYLKLKAYLSGKQLSQCKIGQNVKVYIDDVDGSLRSLEGEVIWISETAEFTPKTIQTREDRVNLVYAFKVKVKNDGSLKIGMPGEVSFK